MDGSLRRIGKIGNQKMFFVFLGISKPVEFSRVVFALRVTGDGGQHR